MEKYLGLFSLLFKQRWKYLVAVIVVLFTCTFYFFHFTGIPKKLIFLVGISSILAIFLIGKNIAKSTFWIILLTGSLFTFITPVLDTPDEHAHFSRAVYLSEGHFGMSDKAEKLKISNSFIVVNDRVHQTFRNDLKNYKHDKQKMEQTIVSLTATYSFISYIPQALGWNLGKLFNLSIYSSFYLGRLLNLIAYAILAYLAVKNVKTYKVPMAVVSTFPMVVYLAASYNQDGLSYGLIFLALSYFLNFITEKDKITSKQIAVFLLLCMILATCKLPYVMLAGILLFIKPSQYENKKTYYFGLVAIVLAIISALLWYGYYTTFVPANRPIEKDPTEQLKFMINNVPTAITLMYVGIIDSISSYLQTFSFGWLSYASPHIAIMYLVYMGGLFVFYPLRIRYKNFFNVIGTGLIMLGIIFAVNLSQYLTWTPIGEPSVIGVQGRYYIGLYVLLPIIINASKIFTSDQKIENYQPVEQEITENYQQTIWIMSMALYFLLAMLVMTLGVYYKG